MSCLTSNKTAAIQVRITRLETLLEAAYTAMEAALTEIEEYRFDSGVGSQRVRYRDLGKMQKAVTHLESQIDYLNRRLIGKGISAMNLRRKGGSYYGRGF